MIVCITDSEYCHIILIKPQI